MLVPRRLVVIGAGPIALAMRTGTTATHLKDGIWTHPSSTETLGKLAVSRP